MKNIKKILILTVILIFNSTIFAKTVTFKNEDLSGTVTFNDDVQIGDAIFVRLNIKFTKNQKKNKNQPTDAILRLLKDKKQINVARFYSITKPKEKSYKAEMIASLPLSTWLKTDENFNLQIIFDTHFSQQQELNIPINILSKNFVSETIDLNQQNSNIKNNMSVERLNQIEKLNTILETVISTDIYDLNNFVKPVESDRKTSFFGDRRTYKFVNNERQTSMHNGIDFGVPEGTQVISSAAGKVVMAEERISTGWSVVVEHLPGLYTLYYHLKSLNVKEGQSVKSGELLGLSGSTGLATGPHLHWEVRLNGSAVNPEFFLTDYTFNKGDLN